MQKFANINVNVKVVNVLLEYYMNLITARVELNYTPLHLVALGGHLKTVLTLLNKEAAVQN